MAHDTLEASVPMEVDPAVGLSPSGTLECVSKSTYAQVVAGTWAIGHLLAPLQGQAGIEGALWRRGPFLWEATRAVDRACRGGFVHSA